MNIEVNRQDLEEVVINLHNIARHVDSTFSLGLLAHTIRIVADQVSDIAKIKSEEQYHG